MLLLFFLFPFWGSWNMCRAASSLWLAIQLLMSPEWLMWSDPYSRLYQRDHNSLWENLWIWMVFSAAWWIIEAVLCKTAHSVWGEGGQERAALGLLRSNIHSECISEAAYYLWTLSFLIWEDKWRHIGPATFAMHWNMNFASSSSSTWFVLCSSLVWENITEMMRPAPSLAALLNHCTMSQSGFFHCLTLGIH